MTAVVAVCENGGIVKDGTLYVQAAFMTAATSSVLPGLTTASALP